MSDDIIPIFRWSGTYVGFLSGGWLFDTGGRYLGWRDAAGRVWRYDGMALGESVETHYVLRRLTVASPVRQTPRVPPVPCAPPSPPSDRLSRVPRPGWADAFETFARRPSRTGLVGAWEQEGKRLVLGEDGQFSWSAPGRPDEVGTWELRHDLIIRPVRGNGGQAERLAYRVVEYAPTRLVLRWITASAHSLLITLHRAQHGVGGGE